MHIYFFFITADKRAGGSPYGKRSTLHFKRLSSGVAFVKTILPVTFKLVMIQKSNPKSIVIQKLILGLWLIYFAYFNISSWIMKKVFMFTFLLTPITELQRISTLANIK